MEVRARSVAAAASGDGRTPTQAERPTIQAPAVRRRASRSGEGGRLSSRDAMAILVVILLSALVGAGVPTLLYLLR